jgi:threonine synthase
MHVTHLECIRCGGRVDFTPAAYLCPRCGAGKAGEDPGVLDVHYDYAAAAGPMSRALRDARQRGVFRFLPVLPFTRAEAVLPAGGTPLVSAPRLAEWVGAERLFLKDETRNPTRSLKDRATAVALTMAIQGGRDTVYCASAGNAGISLAGFSAHRGLACHVWLPAGSPSARFDWLKRFGADVHRTKGSYDDAFTAAERTGGTRGWYSRNCAFNPFLVEGKKTVAYEIAEELGWRVPDVVAAPVGDGCTLGAIGKGFRELVALGLTTSVPRLVGVQATATDPVARRFAGDDPRPSGRRTRAASIDVGRPHNARRVLQEVTTSGGTIVALPDAAFAKAQGQLATVGGLVAELASAAALAGVQRVGTDTSLRGQTVVVVVTGGRTD